MANIAAVYSVGASLVARLRDTYPPALRTAHPCEFRLVSSGELNAGPLAKTTLTLFLYRIGHDPQARTLPRPGAPRSLALELHYLLTVWAVGAEAEHTVMAWAMREMELQPVRDAANLPAAAGWTPGETVEIVPASLADEELLRVWDHLRLACRLSAPYVVRGVRIDLGPPPEAPPRLSEHA